LTPPVGTPETEHACCAGGRTGPHKGHSFNQARENSVNRSYRHERYTATPFYGSRRMQVALQRAGYEVNRKHVQRLMRRMGLEAVGPKPRLSQAHPGHRVYPYLLRDVPITRVDQVWSTDITYVRLQHGFVSLVAILDWYSRYVLAWELSVTVDGQFCLEALETALDRSTPEIFNTDQGAQFTAAGFTGRLETAGAQISMDGRGRALDNVFVERLWRSVKYEEVPERLRFGVRRAGPPGPVTSASTTRSAPTKPSPTEHRRTCTRRRRSLKLTVSEAERLCDEKIWPTWRGSRI
jgi:putative transposase